MGVGRVEAKRRVVDANKGDTHGIQSADLCDIDGGHRRALLVRRVAGHVEAREVEVLYHRGLWVFACKSIDKNCRYTYMNFEQLTAMHWQFGTNK